MSKKLNIRDGVVMGHPYEIAELTQEYANENLERLTEALFLNRGVMAPHTDELRPEASEANADNGVQLSVRPGFAIVGNGIIRVKATASVTLDRSSFQNGGDVRLQNENDRFGDPLFTASGAEAYLVLRYRETRDTPAKIVPYGNGEVDLRVVPGYELTLTDSVPPIEEAVPVGKITASGLAEPSVEDVRSGHAARLRADQTLRDDMVDPALVSDVEAVFSRDGIVEDINELFDNKKLNGERVVTRLKESVEPFFIRTRYEPSARQQLRDLNAVDADLELRPDPGYTTEIEWNIYGVRASIVDTKTVEVYSDFDLQQINYASYDLPLYLRYDGSLYAIDEIAGPNTVVTKSEIESSQSSYPNAAITNGADEFEVVAEPGISWFRKGKSAKDFAIENTTQAPVGQLSLEPGLWNVMIQSRSQDSRSTRTVSVEIPELGAPQSPSSIELTGEQSEPAFEGQERTLPANPFNEVEVDQNGEPKINQEDLDRYIDRVREELKRIQEYQVSLQVDITPQSRSRGDTNRAMTLGYDLTVEMLTGEGWQTERTQTVYRSTPELMRELTWIDLMSERYRGSVPTVEDLENLTINTDRLDVRTDSGRPIRENNVVYVKNDPTSAKNGYWRYEPRMRDDQADDLQVGGTNVHPYGSGKGYWVQVDVEMGSFQADELNVTMTGVKGGADYRVTIQPIGEDGQKGEKTTRYTDELREAFNAQLGFDLHQAINDIYSGYQEMMDTIDPETFNEYLNNRLEEIRKIIDQAALYGTPPKVTGPFDVPRQPGVTRFTGQNLGSVQKVFMQYTPPSSSDEDFVRNEITEEANFKVLVGQGDPQVAIKNLPNIEQLSQEESPIVTLEFNAGARGSDFFAIRYEQSQPSVVGPNVLSFKEERVANIIEDTTYGNTASYWRYDSRVGSAEEPTPYGPLPKRFPEAESADAKSGIFEENWTVQSDTALDGYGIGTDFTITRPEDGGPQRATQVTETVRALQFRAKRMVPSDVLDIRIRRLPEEKLVPQIAYEEAERFEQKIGDPYYYALRHTNNGVEVLVPSRATRLWFNRSYALEYVHYPSSLSGGGLHDGKGLILKNRGRLESEPAISGSSVGDYYYNSAENQPYVCDLNDSGTKAWMPSETIQFGRHTFSVQSDPQARSQVDRIESRFVLETGNPDNRSDIAANPPNLGYDTAPDSARRVPPFSRELVNGASLNLEAPIETTGQSGETYVFDEWRERSNTFSKNRPSLPDNTRAIGGNRHAAATNGELQIRGVTSVDGSQNNGTLYIARYKAARDFSASGEGALTLSFYATNSEDVSRPVVTHGGTEYLLDNEGEVSAPPNTSLSAVGIVTGEQEEWGSSVYPVIRTVDLGEAGTGENVRITGPSEARLLNGESRQIHYEVNKPSIDSRNVGWEGNSLPNTTVSVQSDATKTTISVTVNWSDVFGTDPELEQVRPQDEIGKAEYDGPLYREDEVFDYKDPSLRVKTFRLRVTATHEGISDTKHTAVQLSPRTSDPIE